MRPQCKVSDAQVTVKFFSKREFNFLFQRRGEEESPSKCVVVFLFIFFFKKKFCPDFRSG